MAGQRTAEITRARLRAARDAARKAGPWLLMLCAAIAAARADEPQSAPPDVPSVETFDISFDFSHNGMHAAIMDRTLRPAEDGTYVIETRSHTDGWVSFFLKDRIVERSVWTFHDGRPRPLRYEYHRTGGFKERHIVQEFDWQKNEVTDTTDGKIRRLPIPADSLDKLLYQYVMMLDLQAGRRKLAYTFPYHGRIRTLVFDPLGHETVKTPFGNLDTLRLGRVDDKRGTTVWCAPEYNYLPVRLTQQDGDADMEMVVRSIEGIPRIQPADGD